MKNSVLTVRDNEHMWLVAWESCVRSYLVWKMRGKFPGGTDLACWLSGYKGYKNLIISIYKWHICILLIKTNSMIYICYIFCGGEVEICMLTVRDSEHDIGDTVGDNEDALSDVAEGGTAREKAGEQLSDGAGLPKGWESQEIAGYGEFKERLLIDRRVLQISTCHSTAFSVTIRWKSDNTGQD